MASLWIGIIATTVFILTISLVVIGQEFHPLISIVLAAALVYAGIRLFKARITRI